MKVIVPLAPGLEEIEAVTIIDVLRRADIEVTTASLNNREVTGAHDITITADTGIDQLKSSDFQFIVLPGGMPGSQNLMDDERVMNFIKEIYNSGGHAAAICAAPMVLGRAGILQGKKATCYPGFESHLAGAEYIPSPFIVDDRVITGKGPGCAIPFSLKIVETISGPEMSENLKEAMQVYWM